MKLYQCNKGIFKMERSKWNKRKLREGSYKIYSFLVKLDFIYMYAMYYFSDKYLKVT